MRGGDDDFDDAGEADYAEEGDEDGGDGLAEEGDDGYAGGEAHAHAHNGAEESAARFGGAAPQE